MSIKYNIEGQGITYVVSERTIPKGYTGSSSTVNTDDTSVTIQNSLKRKNIQIVKRWDDDENRDLYRPEKVLFNAYIGNETSEVGSCTASAAAGWTCNIIGLAQEDPDGRDIKYTIKEFPAP
ncbi:MAG: Cna B-type domain-containing protein [Anaerolineaceae bacterium]|nr:Cna B-type domain-containing protein [Anaerolineaceae bacterium]